MGAASRPAGECRVESVSSRHWLGEFGPWFPQTMHLHPSGALLLSYQTSPDTLDEAGSTLRGTASLLHQLARPLPGAPS